MAAERRGYPPLPGWDQSRGHPFLSHTAYSLHAMYLSQRPMHFPLRECIRTPTIQHAPQTEQDDGHPICVPGGQQAQENFQRLHGTRGLLSRFPPIQPQPDQQLHPGHRCQPLGGARCSQGRAQRQQEVRLMPLCGQSHPNGPSLLSGVTHHLCQRRRT